MAQKIPTFYFLYVKAKVYWGFACRIIPFGKSRITLKMPPPSTLIGALAYPLARLKDWTEVVMERKVKLSGANRILNFISSAHAKMDFIPLVRGDLSRVYWYYVLRKEVKTDAVALEKVYVNPLPGKADSIIEMIYLIDQDKAEKTLGSEWLNLLEACAWAISRIGQKEGMISVSDVRLSKAGLIKDGEVMTRFYFPLEACSEMPVGSWIQETFVDVWETGMGDYSGGRSITFAIPFSSIEQKPVDVNVKLSDRGVAMNCDGRIVVTLKRWLGYER